MSRTFWPPRRIALRGSGPWTRSGTATRLLRANNQAMMPSPLPLHATSQKPGETSPPTARRPPRPAPGPPCLGRAPLWRERQRRGRRVTSWSRRGLRGRSATSACRRRCASQARAGGGGSQGRAGWDFWAWPGTAASHDSFALLVPSRRAAGRFVRGAAYPALRRHVLDVARAALGPAAALALGPAHAGSIAFVLAATLRDLPAPPRTHSAVAAVVQARCCRLCCYCMFRSEANAASPLPLPPAVPSHQLRLAGIPCRRSWKAASRPRTARQRGSGASR